MSLSKTKREELRLQFGGCCAFCGGKLPVRGWHAEYIVEESEKVMQRCVRTVAQQKEKPHLRRSGSLSLSKSKGHSVIV